MGKHERAGGEKDRKLLRENEKDSVKPWPPPPSGIFCEDLQKQEAQAATISTSAKRVL